jgi:hypothetical protein
MVPNANHSLLLGVLSEFIMDLFISFGENRSRMDACFDDPLLGLAIGRYTVYYITCCRGPQRRTQQAMVNVLHLFPKQRPVI